MAVHFSRVLAIRHAQNDASGNCLFSRPSGRQINKREPRKELMAPFELAGKIFESKKQAGQYIADLVESLRGRKIHQRSTEFDIFAALLRRHPTKSNERVVFFTVVSTQFREAAVEFKSTSGVSDTFSWRKCIVGGNVSKESQVKELLRHTIVGQVGAFKASQKTGQKWQCSLCALEIISPSQAHVDHIKEFWQLVAEFCNVNGIQLKDVQIKNLKNKYPDSKRRLVKQCEFDDHELQKKWEIYHLRNAELRILCPQCNYARVTKT
jgi:hypothetical protein